MNYFGFIKHPTKICIPVADALGQWAGAGCYQTKLDGVFNVREFPQGVIVGELVGGVFTAFDCIGWHGQDVRQLPLAQRLAMRDTICRDNYVDTVRTVWRDGAGLLRDVLANGGEGVVLKSPGSYYEPMTAAKRSEIFVCRVTSTGATQSVGICDDASGLDRGRVTLRGGKCDQVRVGSIIRVEAMAAHDSGKLRQAQPCREWLVKF